MSVPSESHWRVNLVLASKMQASGAKSQNSKKEIY